MLYIIGLGLGNEKDITVKGLEAVRKCDKVYLDNYTSKLQCSYEDLERFYLKKITLANRETAEQGAEKIVQEAKKKNRCNRCAYKCLCTLQENINLVINYFYKRNKKLCFTG